MSNIHTGTPLKFLRVEKSYSTEQRITVINVSLQLMRLTLFTLHRVRIQKFIEEMNISPVSNSVGDSPEKAIAFLN